MKFENKFVLILVASIAIYAIFLFISDITIIYEKISSFQIIYLPLILSLVTLSWVPLFIKWHILLKNCEINLPIKQSILVFLSGPAFEITPGQVGALMKSQILKNSSNIPRTKTVPIVMIEKVYELIGAIIASVLGIIILELNSYLIIIAILVLIIIFFLLRLFLIFLIISRNVNILGPAMFRAFWYDFLLSITFIKMSTKSSTSIG